jgi:hypothetical protein
MCVATANRLISQATAGGVRQPVLFQRQVRKRYRVFLPAMTGFSVMPDRKGHGSGRGREIAMILAHAGVQFRGIAVIEGRVKIVNADHRAPFVQKAVDLSLYLRTKTSDNPT